MLASLIETCKLHGVNPHAYLTDVLTRLVNNWPHRRLGDLLPWIWTPEAARPVKRRLQRYRSSAFIAASYLFITAA
jgi:hypothetical protein